MACEKTQSGRKYKLTYIRQPKDKVGRNRDEIAPNQEAEIEESENTDEESKPATKQSKFVKLTTPVRYNTRSKLKADFNAG